MRIAKSKVLICLAAAWLLLSPACKQKMVRVAAPPVSSEAANSIARADVLMREGHLFSWRQAESLYQKAYTLSASDEIRNKLLLVRFLILIRQEDEHIPYPAAASVIKDLCNGDPYQRNLCAAAEWIQNGRKPGQLKLNPPIFRGQDPALESYINLLFFQATPRFDAFSTSGTPADAMESPLFLYLNTSKLTALKPPEFEKKYPTFAEGYEYLADNIYQRKQYRQATAFYQKALDLVPDYTSALIGLGNLSFYVLEDHARAERYYDAALKQDPQCAAALLGKGMVRQQLGEYAESNTVLDRMLASRISRNQWIDGIPDAQYYQGEGNYLKGYNYYLLKDPAKAREQVDTAKKFLASAAELYYLSGLIFYEAKNLEPARQDFLSATRMGNYNCNAQLNLGYIYELLKESYGLQPVSEDKEPAAKKSLQYFAAAAGCMDSVVGSLSYQLKTIDAIDLDPAELAAFKARLERKLAEVRFSSASTIEKLIDKVSASPEPEKDAFLKYMKNILSRLRAQ